MAQETITYNTVIDSDESMSGGTRIRDLEIAISEHRDLILANKYLKKVDLPLIKFMNVAIAKNKLRAMKKNSLPLRRSILSLIDFILPVRKPVQLKEALEVAPYSIKIIKSPPLYVPRYSRDTVKPPKKISAKAYHDWYMKVKLYFEVSRGVTAFRLSGFSPFGKLQEMLAASKREYEYAPNEEPFVYETARSYIVNVVDKLTPNEEGEWIRDLTLDGIEPNPGPNRRRVNNTKRKINKNKKKNKPTKGINSASHFPLYTIQPRQTVQHNSCVRDLCFELPIEIFNNAGGPVVTQSFFLNDLFDVLPSILTPAVQFVEYMFKLYKFAKVLSVETIHVFDNLEQTALQAYYFTSAQSLAASFPSKDAVVAQAATAKLRWKDTMSEQYGKRSQIIMRKVLIPWMTLGMKSEYMSSNDFSFTQSTNPARLIYGAWVIIGPLSTINSGVAVTVTLNFRLKFYDALDVDTPIFEEDIPQPPVYSVPDVTKIRANPNRPVKLYSVQELTNKK